MLKSRFLCERSGFDPKQKMAMGTASNPSIVLGKIFAYLVRSSALLRGDRPRMRSQPTKESPRCSPVKHGKYSTPCEKLWGNWIPALLTKCSVKIAASALTGRANYHFCSSLDVIFTCQVCVGLACAIQRVMSAFGLGCVKT